MRILLVSTYELGRQPVHVAGPAARLRAADHEVRAVDLAVEPWDEKALEWPDAVAVSVPMHTAMRLASELAGRIKARRPDLPISFYGLYAAVSADRLVGRLVDRAIVGEYEQALVDWVGDLVNPSSGAGEPVTVHLERGGFRRPYRTPLPGLDRYAHLTVGGEHRLVGAVEASHGCLHRCRHCPIPSVYDGRLRVVDAGTVLADIDQLVDLGARHITFGDPDFLNGPAHSRRIVTAMHERYPELTFDCTVKVEHILRHRHLWDELAATGCLFVVSAFELLDDRLLALLDKGHTAAEAAEAVEVVRSAGIELRPSWLPFTPWSTRATVDEIFRFISRHDLIESTDPVQLGIRLLVPEGSLILEIEGIDEFLEGYDPERLTYRWRSPDPAMDDLALRLTEIAERAAADDRPIGETFLAQWLAVTDGSRLPPPPDSIPIGATEGRPRLTEPWFC